MPLSFFNSMNRNSSKIIGVLSLTLPIIQFFCTSQLFIGAILILLSFLSLFYTSFYSNKVQQKNQIILLPLILILLIIAWIFINPISAHDFSIYLAWSALFIFFITTINYDSNSLISIGVFLIVILEIILLLISFFNKTISFFPNNSILSILLSSQFAFIAPKMLSYIKNRVRKKTNRQLLLFSIVSLSYLFLFISSGRAGLISFSLTIFILNINYFKRSILSKKIIIISITLILLGSLFFVKLNSSNGRILIYKIVLTSINPIQFFTGMGFGQFKVQYNHYQSDYFSKHPINNSEALLADNTYFAFNDPLQLILELGIIGLAILVIFIKTLRKKFISDLRNGLLVNSTLFGAYLCVFSFLSSSLFSYPFQVPNILPLFLLSLAIVFGSIRQEAKMTNDVKTPNVLRIKFLLYAGFSVFLLFLGYKFLNIHYKIKEAENFAKAGFKKKSIALYSNLSNDMIVDGNIYYPFAMELAKLNKTDSAIIVLKKSIRYIYNDHSALLLAKLYYEKGLLNLAERFYKETVFINPKSFRNRFALFTFYVETKQKDKSIYWGKSILELKPKVPSESVANIKNRTVDILQKIK